MFFDEIQIGKPVEAKPDVFSLAGFALWLETQDQSKLYHYTDIYDCPLSRYFRDNGYRWAFCGVSTVNYSRFFLPPLFQKKIPPEMDHAVSCFPHTYGAALKRARAAL